METMTRYHHFPCGGEVENGTCTACGNEVGDGEAYRP